MKKLYTKFILIAVLLCMLAMSFSGCSCSLIRSFEKDVTVFAVDENGDKKGTGTVNIFNNYILPSAPSESITVDGESLPFLGWSVKENFVSGVDSNELIFNANGVVHYKDVENYAKGSEVTLYAIYGFKVIKRHYLTVAWYSRESTSGLNESNMNNLMKDLKIYLKAKGATNNDIKDVVLRAYNGAIADVGANVNADGDVDIIMGVGVNLTSQGGISYIDRYTGFTFGGKTDRVVALLYDSDASRLAYNWITKYCTLYL